MTSHPPTQTLSIEEKIKEFCEMMEFTEMDDGVPCFSAVYDNGGPLAQAPEIIAWLRSALSHMRTETIQEVEKSEVEQFIKDKVINGGYFTFQLEYNRERGEW